jgi:cAMP-dependent protein kinase regulator
MSTLKEREDQNRDFLTSRVNPILSPLVKAILIQKPEDIHQFILDFVTRDKEKRKSGITSSRSQKKLHESFDSEEDQDDEIEDFDIEKVKSSKNRAMGVSAEAYGKYNEKGKFKPKIVEKTQEQKDRINVRLSRAFMFAALEEKERNIVIDAMEVVNKKGGEWVIKQGDDGQVLYVIDEGLLDCYKQFKKTEEPKLVKKYQPGESFGELALLYNAPRAASIQATTDCVLFALDRATFNNIVKDSAIKRRERFEETLGKIELLQDMDPYERSKLADGAKIENYKKGDYVIRQGEEGNTFFLIEEGSAIATKILQGKSEAEQVYEYKKGDYFGELALLNNSQRKANIIASSDLSLLALDRDTFDRMLGPLREILNRNAHKYEKFQ